MSPRLYDDSARAVARAVDYLKAPRIPRACPVSCVKLRTTRSHGGAHYGAFAWVVLDRAGQLVEVLSGSEEVEARFHARYPWFGTQESGWYRDIGGQAWPIVVEVSPAEYRRLSSREPWSENAARIRRVADRCERFAAVRRAINRVLIDGNGTFAGEVKSATIYHRTPARGGTPVDSHLRRAMRAFVRAQWVELVSDPRLDDVVGSYRATPTTPSYR